VSSRRFKIGTGQIRETTPTENIGPPEQLGVGHGADNPNPTKFIVQKPREAKVKLKGP